MLQSYPLSQKFFCEETPTTNPRRKVSIPWIVLLILLSYYIFLRSLPRTTNTNTKTNTTTTTTIVPRLANLRNYVNVDAVAGSSNQSNISLSQGVPQTVFTVPAGKRYLLYNSLLYFPDSTNTFNIRMNHLNSSRSFLLTAFTNEQIYRGLFTQFNGTQPLSSLSATTQRNVFTFFPMILLESGESIELELTSATLISGIQAKFLFWELGTQVPGSGSLRGFYRTVIADDPSTSAIFTASPGKFAFPLGTYQRSLPTGLIASSTLTDHILNNFQTTTVDQFNSQCFFCVNENTTTASNVPLYYLLEPDQVTRIFYNGGITTPANQLVQVNGVFVAIPPGETLYVQNETVNTWTPGSNVNIYGVFYEQ